MKKKLIQAIFDEDYRHEQITDDDEDFIDFMISFGDDVEKQYNSKQKEYNFYGGNAYPSAWDDYIKKSKNLILKYIWKYIDLDMDYVNSIIFGGRRPI